ncbi:MAG TPA: sensor histidine kinase KdpD [Syntrophales bacterium]|nr:sensor histidine kinase KdpD [Syntrophales bacterium]
MNENYKEPKRPDPDALLGRVTEEEKRSRQGRLRIFFGAAPGVGKTYAMLEYGRKKREEGVNVLVGLVETHNRKETELLLEGLPVLPKRLYKYRESLISEFDLDGALARKPGLILVDEIAHTNVPGTRHKKRWQEVFELLEAGIDVATTLNVQHIGSLNDVVFQITGVTVKETVPDSVFDRADEVELVDLGPEDLLQRLKEGKVYIPDIAEQAIKNFFRKGNLIALRELALRRTAETVDAQMRTYREKWGVTEVWPANERILVCVGTNPRSIRLIRAAKRMAEGLKAGWIAVNVDAPSQVRSSEKERQLLAEHIRFAESLGAETVTLFGNKASEEVLAFARSRNVTRIIVGKPTHPRWKDKMFGSFLDEMVRGSGDIDIHVITGDEESGENVKKLGFFHKEAESKEYLQSVVVVSICTVLSKLLFPYSELVNISMIYILGVIYTASRTGMVPSMLTSALSVAAFDFFFVPPYNTFAVSDLTYLLTFVVMFIAAMLISSLTVRIRKQAKETLKRELRKESLYKLSKNMVKERSIRTISELIVRQVNEYFDCKAAVLVPDDSGFLTVPSTASGTYALDHQESGVARWVYDHGQAAGFATDTLPGAKGLYLPLLSSSGILGVLGILPETPKAIRDNEEFHFLEHIANITAIGIERAKLAAEAHQALLKAEHESLRNTLLSSVSHDFRTPLTAITGAVTSLIDKEVSLAPESRQELLATIREEADLLNRMIRNILDMTKIEHDGVKMNLEWQSLEELVGTVNERFLEKLRRRHLVVKLPPALPLIHVDSLLMEQVLTNLIENAVKFTPEGTPIELSAGRKDDDIVTVEIADRGPGIPRGLEEVIFEKFTRAGSTGSSTGLGLTICKAIVEAHGGNIKARNRDGGGASFTFTIPVKPQPSMPEEI